MSKKKKLKKVSKPANHFTIKSGAWIVAGLAFLLYANTLSHDFCLDDFSAIKENYVVKQGFKGIPTLLKTHYRYGYWTSTATLYKPLSLVMFAIEWAISPDNPFIHHLINVLFFAWTGWLLFHLLALLMGDRYKGLSLIIALLFVAHPVHTEVVANIKSRDEIMAFFLGLAGLYYLIKHLDTKRPYWMVVSAILYGMSLFAKESAITWLGLYPLTIWVFRKLHWKDLGRAMWPYLIPTLFFLAVRQRIIGSTGDVASVSVLDNFFAEAHGSRYFGSALYMIFEYLKALIFPLTLVHEKGFNQIPLKEITHPVALLVLVTTVGALIYSIRALRQKEDNQKVIAYGILFFAIAFSIYSNLIITIGSSYGERFLYLPSLGFSIVAGYLIYLLMQRGGKKWSLNNAGSWVLIALLMAYSAKTVSRNNAWRDSATLYATDIVNVPNSAKLNYHHGLEIGKKGNDLKGQAQANQYKQALSYFEKAIKIYPKYADAYGLKGLYLYKLKDFDGAMKAYEKAVSLNRNVPNVYSNMGIIYFSRGDVANAERVYKLALKYNPRFVDAYRNLGAVYATTKRYDLAIEQFQKGLSFDPDNITLLKYLGFAYRDKGQAQMSQKYLNKAAQLERTKAGGGK